MLKKKKDYEYEMEYVCLESLVPKDHLLRKIDKYIDFEFIRGKVENLYSKNNGRPAVDPVRMFKMLFIGYLFGIRSERQLVKEIEVNIAYRWFLEMGLQEKVIDASTLSQNRRRRFRDNSIYQEIFDEIVWQAIDKGLVGGKTLYTDSTHIKASANKNKFIKEQVKLEAHEYLQELEEAVNNDRIAHGKKPLKSKKPKQEIKEKKISTTDPESAYMVRDNKPKGFFYLDHRTVDSKVNIITDVHITPGNVHDSTPYLERLDIQKKKFGFDIKNVGLDAGYYSARICHGVKEREIYGVFGYRRPNHKKGTYYKREYIYNKETDTYTCPLGQVIPYNTTSRDGYRQYKSDPNICINCPERYKCTKSKDHRKVLTRHVWEDDKEKINSHRYEDKGKMIYARRKETVERSFGDSKELHGYRYARRRGKRNMIEQALLTAACQNMKKIALILSRHFRHFLYHSVTFFKPKFLQKIPSLFPDRGFVINLSLPLQGGFFLFTC